MSRSLVSERSLRIAVWASVIAQILIVVTGGAVRLTASGLGCPEWPTCDGSNIVTTPEMGIHGLIEFGNRLLTFVLLVVAVITALLAKKLGNSRKLLSLAMLLIVGIFLQALVGGVSVWFKLNPWIVGLHYVISAFMIAIASVLMWRVYSPNVSTPSSVESRMSNFTVFMIAITELVGVLVTGSGPHAGDSKTLRNGLDPETWQHFHSYPAYVALASTLWLLLLVRRRDVDGYASRLTFWATLGLTAQAVLGVTQARLGLPPELVALHIFFAATLCSVATFLWLSLRSKR